MKVRIKIGASVSQDFSFGKWPQCCPPHSEYEGESWQRITKETDAIFDAEWKGQYWDCRRAGYGGCPYGNGSVFVFDKDGVINL